MKNILKDLQDIKTASGKKFYPEATNYYAPHKPFLLLSIMDLIAQGLISNDFIEPSFEPVNTWNEYWSAFIPKPGERLSPK